MSFFNHVAMTVMFNYYIDNDLVTVNIQNTVLTYMYYYYYIHKNKTTSLILRFSASSHSDIKIIKIII